MSYSTCPKCGGSGEVSKFFGGKKECPECRGNGEVEDEFVEHSGCLHHGSDGGTRYHNTHGSNCDYDDDNNPSLFGSGD